MMKEIHGVTAAPPHRRRWFHDEYFDLFVCETDDGELVSFELCYGVDSSEQAVVWHRDSGFFHDGAVPAARQKPEPVLSRFDGAARELPEPLRASVLERLREYSERRPLVPSRRRRFRRAEWQKLEPQDR